MSGKINKAIILNAGEGIRLRPLTEYVPKCLLKLNDISILEHQLLNLSEFDIKEVVIVVGYYASQIIEKAKEYDFLYDIKFIKNSIYNKTNTVYSLWLAKEEMNQDFIYLNGDVVFHKYVLSRLIDCQYDNCLAIEKKQVGKEEVKVILDFDKIISIGKNIDPELAHGEFIGIAKFSENFNNLFKEKLNEVINEGKINHFFETALDRTLDMGNIYEVDVSNFPSIEIDTYEDYFKSLKIYKEIIQT